MGSFRLLLVRLMYIELVICACSVCRMSRKVGSTAACIAVLQYKLPQILP